MMCMYACARAHTQISIFKNRIIQLSNILIHMKSYFNHTQSKNNKYKYKETMCECQLIFLIYQQIHNRYESVILIYNLERIFWWT